MCSFWHSRTAEADLVLLLPGSKASVCRLFRGGGTKKLKHGDLCEQLVAPEGAVTAPLVNPKQPLDPQAGGSVCRWAVQVMMWTWRMYMDEEARRIVLEAKQIDSKGMQRNSLKFGRSGVSEGEEGQIVCSFYLWPVVYIYIQCIYIYNVYIRRVYFRL